MKKDKAKKATSLLDEIEIIQKEIDHINKIREPNFISIKGQDISHIQCSLSLSLDYCPDVIKKIKKYTKELLKDKLEKLNNELEKL